MTVNANDFNAPDVEIVAHNLPNDEDLEDVTALPFGHDAEEYRSSNQAGSVVNKRNKIILIVTAAILVLCVTGFSADAVTSNNIARSFNGAPGSKSSKAPKTTKAPVAKSTKAPSNASSKSPVAKSTKAPTN
eukprot:scaffold5971_cov111-Skeletonema_dohrnii-CCMP3373.AAC.6